MKKVSLQLGDLFESGPCDLLVLPCSTGGTVAEFVWSRIKQYNLPEPEPGGTLGKLFYVRGFPKELASLSPRLAYAYSVQSNSSSLSAIRSIARELGEYVAKDSSIRRIYVPLLGAGAGGLNRPDVWRSLRDGFMEASNNAGELIVLTPSERIFNDVSMEVERPSRATSSGNGTGLHSTNQTPPTPKRIFISYTARGEGVQNWVEKFATELRQAGLNARADFWDLQYGMDLPDFMASEISQADKVLIVADANYAERANGKLGGVGWETMLIQGDYLSNNLGNLKYILITLGEDRDQCVPNYLKTKFSAHFNLGPLDRRELVSLVKTLHSVVERPELRTFEEWMGSLD